ncbi:MAG TPA: PASTA domain-containing protein [Vicinamibacterales bacterium]|nr:PASTA domain-containing protein [Vicinamibacterales bacterium]
MLGRTAALRLTFVTLLTFPSASRSLADALEPQDVRSASPARVLQTSPARTAQMQMCLREVPDLSRYNGGSAGAVLGKFDLTLGSIQPQKSGAPKGTVVGQSVKPGTQVRCGTRVDVYVSDGMPDVRQTTPYDPNLRRPIPSTSDGPPNSDTDGRRPVPPDVDFRRPIPGGIDRQPLPVTDCPAPSLVDHSYVDVRERLRGWTIGSVEKVETRAAREGMILKQSPAPRTMVKCNSSIDIAVAVAPPIVAPPPPPPPPPCVVPGIESGDVASARQVLARRNLTLGSVNRRASEKSPGTVIGQRPAPDTTIACGSTVDVWIAVPLPLVRVPPLHGQDVTTARRTLDGVGLTLGTAERRESELPIGGVVDQLPLPETEVKPGTAVNVWLSAGVPLVRIPDLRGRDRTTATEILSSQQLRLGEVSERAADATPGTVVDQQPRPGTMARRETAVRVWMASSIEVPSVIGRREADATAILTNQRLRVGAIQTRESSEPAGTVIEQHPQPRRPARLNAPVDLVLAIPATVAVPDLRGRNRQAALAALTDAELLLGETTAREAEGPAGVVTEQSPRAGERVEVGTAVQVWVAVPIRVQVPDLRGSTRDASSNVLRARRLVLGSIESRISSGVPGRIVDQQPAAGTRVEAGTAVTIWIAAAAPPDLTPPQVPALLEVPDLKGRTRDQALAILADRGLVLGQASTIQSNDTPDTVVSQQPAGASRVPPGTGVDVVLAAPPVPPPPVPPAGGGAAAPPPVTDPPDGPTPLVWLLLAAGVAAALAGITVKARTRTPREHRELPPSITFVPQPDPQMNVELSADGPFTRAELWLRPSPDPGNQAAFGSGPLGMIEVTEMR